jgi:hypothetical protein
MLLRKVYDATSVPEPDAASCDALRSLKTVRGEGLGRGQIKLLCGFCAVYVLQQWCGLQHSMAEFIWWLKLDVLAADGVGRIGAVRCGVSQAQVSLIPGVGLAPTLSPGTERSAHRGVSMLLHVVRVGSPVEQEYGAGILGNVCRCVPTHCPPIVSFLRFAAFAAFAASTQGSASKAP